MNLQGVDQMRKETVDGEIGFSLLSNILGIGLNVLVAGKAITLPVHI